MSIDLRRPAVMSEGNLVRLPGQRKQRLLQPSVAIAITPHCGYNSPALLLGLPLLPGLQLQLAAAASESAPVWTRAARPPCPQDPFDGLVTCRLLRDASGDARTLGAEIADYDTMASCNMRCIPSVVRTGEVSYD